MRLRLLTGFRARTNSVDTPRAGTTTVFAYLGSSQDCCIADDGARLDLRPRSLRSGKFGMDACLSMEY